MSTEAFWLWCAKRGVPVEQIENAHKVEWNNLRPREREACRQELQRVVGEHIADALKRSVR